MPNEPVGNVGFKNSFICWSKNRELFSVSEIDWAWQ
jgi:hypothetical protein